MAALTVTASQVIRVSGTVFEGTAGATITAGQSVYLDTSDSTLKLADADAEGTAAAKGIALHGASASQPLDVQTSGTLTIGAGAAPTAGEVYVVHTTAGGIGPYSDLISGDYVTILGVANASNQIVMGLKVSGVAKA